ncbi:MAG: DMT family transporter [Hyphomicrobiaceae bacterium]|jgi:drug/metabolite transporter (DMT)-like permease
MHEPVPRRPTARPEASARQRFRAILLICLAVTCFSGLDATGKYLVSNSGLPLSQVVWLRFFGQFVGVVVMLGVLSVPRLLMTNRIWHQVARSFLMLGSTVLNFMALRELRLDQTTTILFLAPLCVALLAGPFLGEWIGWRRMLAVLVGFCGILIVVRPGYASFQVALLYSFAGMLCYTGFILLTRFLSAHDAPVVTLFYSLLAGTYLLAPFAIVDWEWPTEPHIYVLLCMLGFWGGLGHYLFILAHRHASTSTVAPFLYVQLLSTTGLGYVVFGDVPDGWSIVGAGIIVMSGIYLVYRERKVREGK